ncbi:MAG: phage tail tape measure protein [Alphaproteobacteria bacterium]|nr:phage tail tape measure protein [Alphaproteobacteria bacterium]
MADDTKALFAELRDEMSDTEVEMQRLEGLADGFGRALSNGLGKAITDGRSFRSVLGDIAQSFADIALKAALSPVETLAAGLIESLFTSVQPFAKGGVIATPSYFPLSGGLGLAGEAGPEAILPLTRGSDGRLGVASNAAQPISIALNVTANDARSFVGAEAEMSAMLLRAVRRGTRAS